MKDTFLREVLFLLLFYNSTQKYIETQKIEQGGNTQTTRKQQKHTPSTSLHKNRGPFEMKSRYTILKFT